MNQNSIRIRQNNNKRLLLAYVNTRINAIETEKPEIAAAKTCLASKSEINQSCSCQKIIPLNRLLKPERLARSE
jgi:hypothetical protein